MALIKLPDEMAGIEDTDGEWISSISWADRLKLRAVVRKVHLRHLGQGASLPDRECDKLIDAWGPEVCAKVIRQATMEGKA